MEKNPIGLFLLVVAFPACGTLTYYVTDDESNDPAADDPDPGDDDDDDDDDVAPTDTDPEATCAELEDCGDPACVELCDADGDGVVSALIGGEDCDDEDEAVHPGASEVCDEIDNDCDQDVDGDVDGDGVGMCADCDDSDPTRRPGIADYCGDTIDSDCDNTDCIFWSDGFESGALDPVWNVGGALPWFVGTIAVNSGTYSAVSGPIVDMQVTTMGLSVDFPAGGAVKFWHSGETEYDYDFLRFSIDGVERGRWAGTWTFQEAMYVVPAGTHTFEWTYDKDMLRSHATDQVMVDDVSFEGGTP